MLFEIHMFVFLLLQTYLKVAHSDEVHNENRSGGHNLSLAEETTDLIDQHMRLNITQVNEKNINDPGSVQHVSKKKNKRRKTRKMNRLHKFNPSADEEEDNIQIGSLERPLNKIPTRKTGINEEKTCEAMVLTYGPIGFTSALELIGNASGSHNHSLHTNNDPSNSSRSKVRQKLNKIMGIEDADVVFSSQEASMYVNNITAGESSMNKYEYKSEGGDSEIDENVHVRLPQQYHQNIRNKQSEESIISDSTRGFGYNSHEVKYVLNSKEQIGKENGAIKSEALEEEKMVFLTKGNDKPQDKNKYSVLRVLWQQNVSGLNFPRDREDEMEQASNSLPTKLIISRRGIKYSKPLYISNKSAGLDANQNSGHNSKPCPKQPKFIDKITIDKGNYYNDNQNIADKHHGIDTKYALEHFRAKTKQFEDEVSSYYEKSVREENDEERVTFMDFEENSTDEKNKSFDSGNIKQKIVQKRYVPLLHPMPETEDDKNKDVVSVDSPMVGGSNRFDGQTTHEIRKELVGHFHSWPKTREWLYSDQNTKTDGNDEPTNIKLPIHIYESPLYYSDPNLENWESAETYDINMQDHHLEPDEIFVYVDDTIPHEFVSEPPFQYELNHQEHDENYNIPLNQENNRRTMTICNTNEADYYPIDYPFLFKKDEYQNGYVPDQTDLNDAMYQLNVPEYLHHEAPPLEMPIYQTDQQYSSPDYPQPIVSVLEKSTEEKHAKPTIKIFKAHFKPTDYLERNTANQRKQNIGYKSRIIAHCRKKKVHRKCKD